MADLTPEQRMNVDEWIGALRSGEYKQTIGRLRDEDGYCCLGVLADTQGVDWEWRARAYAYVTVDPDEGACPTHLPTLMFERQTGLNNTDMADLITMNDSLASFDDIADEIKRRVQ